MKKVKLSWHISRAVVEFPSRTEIDRWLGDPIVYFEFTPDQSDDGGSMVFANPLSQRTTVVIDQSNGGYTFTVNDHWMIVSAWVELCADVVDHFDQSLLDRWSSERGGWASCSILFSEDVDPVIISDQGGGWNVVG